MEFKKLETSIIRNRVYEHYRGNRYLVIEIAKDSDKDGDNFVVIYRALYGHGQLYSSSLDRFTGVNKEGKQRFTLVDIEEHDRNPDHIYPTLTM